MEKENVEKKRNLAILHEMVELGFPLPFFLLLKEEETKKSI